MPADVTVMSKKRRLRKARQYMREFQEVQERMTDALGRAMAQAMGKTVELPDAGLMFGERIH
jgi:flagellar motor switch protein FliM